MSDAHAAQINPKISFEIFIHKVDGLSDEHKIGMRLLACLLRASPGA
jgi:hypothetical protein